MQRGVVYGVLAYVLWGLLPAYWKLLAGVPAMEILSHRVCWSLVVCVGLCLVLGRWQTLLEVLRSPRVLLLSCASTALLSLNWGLYIWSVNSGYIVETSLGYFINPLVNVALGVALLGEQMRRLQWIAIAAAALGVVVLTVAAGKPPWISLTLAFSFAFYGLLKKRAPLPALEGLTVETALVTAPAAGYLAWLWSQGSFAFTSTDVTTGLFLAGAGVATATPLLFFAASAQRIPLSVVGFLQYIAPTMQFVLGVFVYKEAFGGAQLAGFSLIWLALVLFATDAIRGFRQSPARH